MKALNLKFIIIDSSLEFRLAHRHIIILYAYGSASGGSKRGSLLSEVVIQITGILEAVAQLNSFAQFYHHLNQNLISFSFENVIGEDVEHFNIIV